MVLMFVKQQIIKKIQLLYQVLMSEAGHQLLILCLTEVLNLHGIKKLMFIPGEIKENISVVGFAKGIWDEKNCTESGFVMLMKQ